MNISALRTFLTIVETGSLVKASKQLHVTQSTITARLQNLEEELGQTLINRQKSGVTLTSAGERFRRYARPMTDLWRQAKQQTALPNGVNAICNIGCHPDLWPHLGQNLFEQLRKTQPTLALSVWLGSQSDLDAWIRAGLVDVSISYWATGYGNMAVHSLHQDRLVLVSTCVDSLIKSDPCYVYIEYGEEFEREHAAAYADADIAQLSFGQAELGLQHILQNGGSAYLPLRIVQEYLDKQHLYRLSEAPEFQRKIYLVVNDNLAEELDVVETVQSLVSASGQA